MKSRLLKTKRYTSARIAVDVYKRLLSGETITAKSMAAYYEIDRRRACFLLEAVSGADVRIVDGRRNKERYLVLDIFTSQ